MSDETKTPAELFADAAELVHELVEELPRAASNPSAVEGVYAKLAPALEGMKDAFGIVVKQRDAALSEAETAKAQAVEAGEHLAAAKAAATMPQPVAQAPSLAPAPTTAQAGANAAPVATDKPAG